MPLLDGINHECLQVIKVEFYATCYFLWFSLKICEILFIHPEISIQDGRSLIN